MKREIPTLQGCFVSGFEFFRPLIVPNLNLFERVKLLFLDSSSMSELLESCLSGDCFWSGSAPTIILFWMSSSCVGLRFRNHSKRFFFFFLSKAFIGSLAASTRRTSRIIA